MLMLIQDNFWLNYAQIMQWLWIDYSNKSLIIHLPLTFFVSYRVEDLKNALHDVWHVYVQKISTLA